jgi:hypothetical protein
MAIKMRQLTRSGLRSVGGGSAEAYWLGRIDVCRAEDSVWIAPRDPEELRSRHTVFCEASLPHRNPGRQVRDCVCEQGRVILKLSTREALDPNTGRWVNLGLPSGRSLGPAHLNSEALIRGSRELRLAARLPSRCFTLRNS